MFSNIFFLIIVLLLIGFLPEVETQSTPKSLLIGFIAYGAVLLAIVLQNRWNKSPKMLNLTNLELIAFLCFFYFILGAHAIFLHSMTLLTLVSVAIYFIGLAVHHATSHSRPLSQIGFLLPIILPFLFIAILIDIETFIPGPITFPILASLALILLLLIFPMVLQFFWKCKPIENVELRDRLLALCDRLHFKHAGIKTWTIMQHALTAGIVGIVPRFRYVMFTERILNEMPPPCLEAVLAHEIAHSKLKHLIFYPFIIMGMSVAGAIIFLWIGDAVTDPLLTFFIYVAIAAVYFRVVFGYFSRIFERQADLYVFAAGIPYQYMTQALDMIGTASGNIHKLPNWHHYSIQERIDFLCNAAIDSSLIAKHNAKVKWSIIAYFVILTLLIIYLFGASS